MNTLKRASLIFPLMIVILVWNTSVRAAGELDTSFTANLTNSGGTGWSSRVLVLPDGKVLVAVRVPALNGSAVGDLVRLNADGTVDTSFNSPDFYPPGSNAKTIYALAIQEDGKILVGGSFEYVNAVPRNDLARLNIDGSLDTTFPNILPSSGHVEEIVVYPDGRILVGGNFDLGGGLHTNLARLSANGVVDPTFVFGGLRVESLLLQPNGKIVVGEGINSDPRVKRYDENGNVDATFTQINLQANAGATDMEYLPDGRILIAGYFTTVNGASRVGVCRANSDGTIDGTFVGPGLNGGVNAIALDSGGKFYIGGSYSQIGGASTSRRAHRLNADGTHDAGFSFFDSNTSLGVTDIAVQPDAKVVVISNSNNPISRATTTGSADAGFVRPAPRGAGQGYSIWVQSDNKILVGGRFDFANSTVSPCLTRLNPDGTRDSSFMTAFGTCNFGQILSLVQQPDGKLLVAGNGEARRLNIDGTLSASFSGTPGTLNYDIDYLPDGKVLIASGTLRRFNTNGTLDTTLATVSGGGSFPNIFKVAVQPDAKIIIVGNFTSVNGTPRNRIARLNSDGSVDMSFNADANADVSTVVAQADGKILIGGGFTAINSAPNIKHLARLNSNGSTDLSFEPHIDGPALAIKIQSDGRILFGGAFAVVNGVLSPRLGRVEADGSLDESFHVGGGPNSTVWGIDQQSDGKIVYVGEFFRTDGKSTLGVGRMLNTPPSRPFDYDGDGKADVSVFRSSENKWYILRSSDSSVYQPVFAINGDIPVPADYDGDQKTDVAIFRPSSGQWWYLSTVDGSQVLNPFGQSGDIPRPSDFDVDGKTDFVLFRPSNNTWYRYGSLAGNVSNTEFGVAGDQPVIGDFDGDGKSDLAVFRPSTGDWWYAATSAGGAFRQTHWGQSGDLPVPADYDGDAKTDFAVFRPADGGWYVLNSSNGSFTTTAFGVSSDRPVAADYDGDGRADLAVFRPSTGIWYLLRSTSGFAGLQFGISTDTPTPSSYVP